MRRIRELVDMREKIPHIWCQKQCQKEPLTCLYEKCPQWDRNCIYFWPKYGPQGTSERERELRFLEGGTQMIIAHIKIATT